MLNEENEVEKILENLGLEPNYRAVILELSAYVTPILSFIPRSIPKYTDHGVRHSNNILNLLDKFRGNLSTIFPSFSFSKEELFLLAISAYLHDIGCIVQRRNHNRESARLLTEDASFSHLQDKLGADLLKCLKLISLSHSSNFDLCGISKEKLHQKVRLRLICAIFRLLDACEISATRTSKTLFDILTRNNKISKGESKYWEGHLSIIGLFFENNEIILDCEDKEKPASIIKHLQKDLNDINKVFAEEKFPTFTIKVVQMGF
jgi:hypothetical protein